METNTHNLYWGFQNHVASWLNRNLCPPEHNFSWLALTEDEFVSSGAAKNKILDKFLITFWAKSEAYSYTCHIPQGKIACTKQYAVFPGNMAVLIFLGLKICACLSLNCSIYLYSKVLCTEESKCCVFKLALLLVGKFKLQFCLFTSV